VVNASIAEAFRRRVTVLELQQIIGRGCGVWRTADNPLHVLLLEIPGTSAPMTCRNGLCRSCAHNASNSRMAVASI
jgi:hypothetical protein